MAQSDDNQDKDAPTSDAPPGGLEVAPEGLFEKLTAQDGDGEDAAEEEGEPAHLGATKYVHAAFFAAGILAAFLTGKLLAGAWNWLAEWPTAVGAVPQLLKFDEEERGTLTMLVGAVVGVLAVVQTYRKQRIRQFSNEVAVELSKVTWPNKETVTNGTIVVIVASAVATIYIALLDRLWAFVTALIYRA